MSNELRLTIDELRLAINDFRLANVDLPKLIYDLSVISIFYFSVDYQNFNSCNLQPVTLNSNFLC